MVDHFVSLICPNCGGKLDVYSDMDQFACGYCGTSIHVSRRGGALELKPVVDAIAKVQAGTEKTAAELALKRIGDELVILKKQEHKLHAEISVLNYPLCCGIMMFVMAVPIFFANAGLAAILALIGAPALGYGWSKYADGHPKFPALQTLRAEIAQKESRLADLRQIADS